MAVAFTEGYVVDDTTSNQTQLNRQLSSMDYATEALRPVSRLLDRIQSIVALEFLEGYPQFEKEGNATKIVCVGDKDSDGNKIDNNIATSGAPPPDEQQQQAQHVQGKLGRIGFLSCILGILWGVHFCLLCLLPIVATTTSTTPSFISMRIWPWCFYVWSMCTFHLSEFFVTCLYNPTVVNSDSFLVNHSKAYTAAAVLAMTEFWMKFIYSCFVSSTLQSSGCIRSTVTTFFGVMVVIGSQLVRSWSMKTCGESFNHFIQTQRKDNHKLVTDGIYRMLRHPSYVGFYYWSIGTQIVLQNWICVILFALAGWSFFSRRIPYEELALIRLFGNEYHEYAARTYIGIPGISTSSLYHSPDHDGRAGSNYDSCRHEQGQEMQFKKSNATDPNRKSPESDDTPNDTKKIE